MPTLAAFLVAYAISSPRIGEFFRLPDWMPTSVPSSRTPGSDYATNATHRLDATSLAAVNALFEGYYERVYCFNECNSNSWDQSRYGTIQRGYRFPLAFGDGFTPPGFVYDGAAADTNREVRSRRLLEYANLGRLARAVGCGGHYLEDVFHVYRPSWTPNKSDLVLSSSLFDDLPGHESVEIPNADWLSASSFIGLLSPAEWARVAMTWQCTRHDALEIPPPEDRQIAAWFTRKGIDMNCNFLPTWMLNAVNFNEPPFHDDAWLRNGLMPNVSWLRYYASEPPWFITCSTPEIIGYGDGKSTGIEGITNATRRLAADRAAGIGRALAALDRSYYRIEPDYPHSATNVGYTLSMVLASDPAEVAIEWDEDGAGHLVHGPVEFGPLAQDGEVVCLTNNGAAVTVPEHYAARVGRSLTVASPMVIADPEDAARWRLVYELTEADMAFVADLIHEHGCWEPVIPFMIDIDECLFWVERGIVDFGLYVNLSWTEDGRRQTYYDHRLSKRKELPTVASLRGTASYTRSYDYLEHVEPGPRFPDGRHTHPGPFGFTRCRDASVWSVSGAGALAGYSPTHVVTTDDDTTWVGQHTSLTFDGGYYRSDVGKYSNADACRQRVKDAFGAMKEKVDDLCARHCGTPDFRDPFATIPVSETDLAGMHVVADDETTLGIGGYCIVAGKPLYSIYGRVMGSTVVIDAFGEHVGGTRRDNVTPHWPILVADLGITADGAKWKDGDGSPRVRDFYGVSAGGYVESWSRVDWNWGALNRNR